MFKKILLFFFIISVCLFIGLFVINGGVVLSTRKQIINQNAITSTDNFDCIIVLGAGVWGNEPSPLLRDRLDRGIELYLNGIAPKIIMSGDHGHENYDEVNIMKKYAIARGVPSSDIFMDHAGFSTYDSIYRAQAIFQARKIIIVSQKYHLYRALYIANSLGVEAYGVAARSNNYSGNTYREMREVLARNKDFAKCIFKPESTYLGETISLNGDGNITND